MGFKITQFAPTFEYKKLPVGFKDKWVEALESDRYAQAKGSLAVENVGYCCLGIACKVVEIADKHLINFSDIYQSQDEYYLTGMNGVYTEDAESAKIIEKRVPKELLINEDLNNYFAKLNDKHNLTFKQIARIIKKYF